MEHVILVDSKDNPIGLMEKMEAHKRALLHRAFSVVVFNSKGEMMLQKRAADKYHSPNLWTNTCCSHPRQGESVLEAARRRLQEEMGFECHLDEAFSFLYRAELDQDLVEHELDHVVIGRFDGAPELNPEEAADWKWASPQSIAAEIAANPEDFTEWFKILLPQLEAHLKTA